MRHYTCDVCGESMPEKYERSGKKPEALAGQCQLEDVCPRCMSVGREIPVTEILLRAWREAIRHPCSTVVAEEVPAADEAALSKTVLRAKDCPKFAGRSGSEKRVIFDRLKRFRGDPPRLGCLREIEEQTGGKVTSDTLREVLVGMIDPPIDVWRLIWKALDKLEGQNE